MTSISLTLPSKLTLGDWIYQDERYCQIVFFRNCQIPRGNTFSYSRIDLSISVFFLIASPES